MKTCTKCKQMKPLAEFGNKRSAFDGKQQQCKECINFQRRVERFAAKRQKTIAEQQKVQAEQTANRVLSLYNAIPETGQWDRPKLNDMRVKRYLRYAVNKYNADPDRIFQMVFVIGKCDICGKRLTPGSVNAKNRPHIDHCHKTGNVRGVLCPACNHMIGHARDNVKILNKAITYLNERKPK